MLFSRTVKLGSLVPSTTIYTNASNLPDRTAQMAPSCDGVESMPPSVVL